MKLSFEDGKFYLDVPYSDLHKANRIPSRRFMKRTKLWRVTPTVSNVDYIVDTWPDIELTPEAEAEIYRIQKDSYERERVLQSKQSVIDTSVLNDTLFKHPPYDHQREALVLARDLPNFAYFMDQGTGKTKSVIDDAAHNYRKGRIEALLIVAPNSVKSNWVDWESYEEEPDEIDNHMPPDIDYTKGVWISTTRKFERLAWDRFEAKLTTPWGRLVILAVNYDALTMPRVYGFLERFCQHFAVMIAADESTFIKHSGSKRTKAAIKLRQHCKIARIMSGTPIIQSPLNAYSQFQFLDPAILGFGSYYAFRNRYCVMGGFEGKQVLFYQNLDELAEKISSCSYRVLKDDCLDLPPKVYMPKRRIKLTAKQAKAYKEMSRDMLTTHEKGIVSAQITLTQILRLSEITSGYLPVLCPRTGKRVDTVELVSPSRNPKMQDVMHIIEESGGQQFVIWSRFTAELEGMLSLLKKAGISCARFDGKLNERESIRVRKAFQRGELDGLVANPAKGGVGIPLFKGTLVMYLSNSPNTEHRVQSEDRTHRQGTTEKVSYYDFQAPGTVDVKVVRALRNNKNISDEIMRDGFRSWI